MIRVATGAGLALAIGLATGALAAEPLKIGLLVPVTGPYADYGKEIERGMKLYLATRGDTVAGRNVELVLRDDAPGTSGEIGKRIAQELIVNDKVDVLAGFGLTPEAFAAAPLITEARIPAVIMNASTSSVTAHSPYFVRTSQTMPQVTAPIATWAYRNAIRKVYILVADYGPGHDAEEQFRKTFITAGGTIVGDVRVPVGAIDFSAYLQRVKDVGPEAVFLFIPPGSGTIAFMKDFANRGLAKAGIRIIATGALTDEDVLDAYGDAALGIVTSFHYSEAHASPENRAYVEAWNRRYPDERPNFMSVAGYDGMHLIAAVVAKTGGSTDAEAFVNAAKGMGWTSPRGPITIDPTTRDLVQTVYIRRVEKVNGRLQNVEFDRFPDFRDPGAE